jgi:hypothetical protein
VRHVEFWKLVALLVHARRKFETRGPVVWGAHAPRVLMSAPSPT